MKKSILSVMLSVGMAAIPALADIGTFAKKVTFTVDYDGPNAVADIPVLVRLAANSPEGFAYADCASDGSDLRFFDADGAALPFEIDTWNSAGESLVWVKAPAVVRDTTFTMTFGGTPAAANTPSATWSGYTGVWHLNDLGTDATQYSQGIYPNSTAATGIDAHLSSVSIPNQDGKFGKSFRPNDSTGYMQGNYQIGGAWVVDPGADSPIDSDGGKLTVSGWIRHQDWFNAGDERIFYKRLDSDNADSPNGAFVVEAQGAPDFKIAMKGSGSNRNRDDGPAAPSPRTDWIYVTAVFDGQTHTLYVNGGEFSKTGNYLSKVNDNDAPLVFGNTVTIADGETGSNAWNGWIDEVRFVKGVKSAEWIAAEYAAMADANFLSAGKVEDVGPTVPKYEVSWSGAANATVVAEVNENPIDSGAMIGSGTNVVFTVTPNMDYEFAAASYEGWALTEGILTRTITVGGEAVAVVIPDATEKSVPPPPPPPSGDGILPGATPTETRQTIQDAIDAAAPTQGTVTLAAELFEIDAQLFVTNGVTLEGQGWTNTVVKYVGTANTADSRVATLSGGSTLSKVSVTGAKVGQNGYVGGAVTITGTEGATISWCCITNNLNGNACGGGIGIYGSGSVKIDHTIVANNTAGVNVAAAGGGIGTRPGATGLSVEIDSCLVYGNSVGKVGNASCGGGIGIVYKKTDDGATDLSRVSAVIRNTTIADNTVVGTGKGGGLYCSQNGLVLQNCIIADNAASTDTDVGYMNETIAGTARLETCLIGGTTAFVGNGDYHLSESYTAAIAKGAAYAGIGDDLDGRPFAATPSVGCYEYQSSKPSGVIMLFR